MKPNALIIEDEENRFSPWLLSLVALMAICALCGKPLHMLWLQAWSPGTVTMKETTAWLLLQHTWTGFIISRAGRKSQVFPVYFIASLTLLMGVGLALEIFQSPLELASFDPLHSFYPSVVTVLAACLLALKAFAAVLFELPWLARALSWIVSGIGASALIGYALGIPAMYFFIRGYTTAMAINTALCFFLLGLVYVPPGKT